MIANFVRLVAAGLLIVPAGGQIGTVADIPAFALFVALVLTVLFSTKLFSTRAEKAR
ncbi:hypothetical protein L6E12_26100 [Actinokineospora sp. PR83]|uniref:hypothetical protein n=1 Tax=Actinokineospora sp. PR83 TaxID=2884908 RepID=UPI001F2193FF|nr:hypothetical protein [Actinokineospora sp. PR83]MCG8919252.1 hypothetical protein [Actinokineospora sp. PR83]